LAERKKAGTKRRILKRRPIKIFVPEDAILDYKNIDLLKKFLTDRGKLLARRLTGVTAPQQRYIMRAIKQARFLGLLSAGSAKRK
jgi:small subunit ribosomal protein S18